MNKENKLVPKLRFPEFVNEGSWNIKTLGDVTYNVGVKNKDRIKYPIYSINNKVGFVPQSEQFDGVDSNTRGYDISLYKVIERNTFAYNPARINVGSIGYSGELHNIIVSSLYVCFKTTEDITDKFLQSFLDTNTFNESVNNNVEGGIRNYLFYENFSRIKVCLPKPTEQHKIASCLSSLDELITAHTDKLDALRDHKKGLMQQLFPAEGETLPKLRFKEFEKDGEWVETKISSIGYVVTGSTPSKDNDEFWDGDFVWITAQDFKDKYISNSVLKLTQKGKNKSRIIPTDSVLVTCIASIGLNAINKIECATNQQINAIVCNDNNFFEFVYYVIEHNKNRLKNLAGQTAVPIINKTVFESFEIKIPKVKAEQQKIANFLSSIDDEITAQTQKIEALKEHKKGLMQGLFPVINE